MLSEKLSNKQLSDLSKLSPTLGHQDNRDWDSDSESDSSTSSDDIYIAPRISVNSNPNLRTGTASQASASVLWNPREGDEDVGTNTRMRTPRPSAVDRAPNVNTSFLKSPRTANYSTATIESWFEAKLVDVEALYQRGIVWSNKKQRDLIDSIINNYYVPPVVLSVQQHQDRSETRICIDGKQRLTSIYRFMNGEIYYKDRTSGKKLYFIRPANADPKHKFALLSPTMRDNFKRKQVSCAEYDGVTEVQEREIFQRVQLGIPLKPKEKLPSTNGPYPDVVRRLLSQFDSIPAIARVYSWGSGARSHDFQIVSQMLYLVSEGCDSAKLEPTNQRLVGFLNQKSMASHDQNIQVNALQATELLVRIFEKPLQILKKRFSSFQFVLAHFFVYNCQRQLKCSTVSDHKLRSAVALFLQDFPNAGKFKTAKRIISKHISEIPNEAATNPVRANKRRDRDSEDGNDPMVTNKRTRTDTTSTGHTVTIKQPVSRNLDSNHVDSRLAIPSNRRSQHHRHRSSIPTAAGPSTFTGCFKP